MSGVNFRNPLARNQAIVADTRKSPYANLYPVPINVVRLQDNFWSPRIEILREVTLPTQCEIWEKTGRIDNFRRASGKIKGDFRGACFNDSDVYKWLEAVAFTIAYKPDDQLIKIARSVIAEIAAAQDEDGYLNTYFTFGHKHERWSNLKDMHELYCAGHLFQAGIAYHRSTGDDTLLKVAIRLADHILRVFGPDKREGTPGHPEIEMALVELYRETGKCEYLDLAQFFIDKRGHGLVGGSLALIDHKPFRELTEIVGHAVRSCYLNGGVADIVLEKGEKALLTVLENLWHNMTERKMYVTGGIGARYEGEVFGDDYELPNERAYAETCAAIANIMWNWRMLLLTGEARFADVLELALYNGALSGISLDGKSYFYVNPLAAREGHRRQTYFECACCLPNIARLLASLPGYFYTTSTDGIFIHLYATSTSQITFGGQIIQIEQHTQYPWDGEVEIVVQPSKPSKFTLFLRVPSWCPNASVRINGKQADAEIKPGTYMSLRREWHSKDTSYLLLSMPAEAIAAHPFVRAGAGCIALRRGPLIYSVEGTDNPDFDVWQLMVSPDVSLRAEKINGLLNDVVVLRGNGFVADMRSWARQLYLPLKNAIKTILPVNFTAIPYYGWANREPSAMTVWIGK